MSPQSFRRDSYRNPNGVRKDSGYGYGKGSGFGGSEPQKPFVSQFLDGPKRSLETWATQTAWAREHLPDEHAPFVASQFWPLQKLGIPITPENVMARLRARGLDKATMEEDA